MPRHHPNESTAGRKGEFAAFFDGLEALRARVEDPHARRNKIVVDFDELRDDLPRYISKFELFRPLLWAFFQGLVRSKEWQSAEMLLSVLVEALPFAVDRDRTHLTGASRFVAAGALELRGTEAAGVPNRLVLHTLARLLYSMFSEDEPVTGAEVGRDAAAAERAAWTALTREIVRTFAIEKDRLLLGYAQRVFREILLGAGGHPGRQHTISTLWTELVDEAFARVAPGRRAPGIDSLLSGLVRLLSGSDGLPLPEVQLLVDGICALPRCKRWWASYVEQQAVTGAAAALPEGMVELALASLRTAAAGESAQNEERRILALAAVCSLDDRAYFEELLGAKDAPIRRAAVRGLGVLLERLRSAPEGPDGAVDLIATHLIDALQDADAKVVRAAVVQLGACSVASALSPLLAQYRLTPDSKRMLRADILEAIARIAATRPETVRAQRAYFAEEHGRYQAQARGRQLDRILTALDALRRG